ncbi:MAG: glutamate-1-semialdehyde 2,1-aminomutase [Gammaproteobacteria bacterium]|nr:glutamate-1-semialdehyde 2,1-aminomutase [Gammaproteobacteria bacterium]
MTGDDEATLFRRACAVTPGGVHSPVRAFRSVGGEPFFTRRAAGARLTTTAGRELIDFCMAFGPLVLGHAHPAVAEAAREALADGWSYGTAEPYSLELAELIARRVPWAESIRFVSSGTEAVMAALRLARGATGRTKLLKFAGCYHGHTDAMLIRAGSGLAGVADSAGVTPGVAADTVVVALDDEAALAEAFARHGAALAAAIIEPLPANFGLLPQRDGFLRELRALCTQYDVLLVFDEVITGFRLAFGGYAEVSGLVPDLVTYGKVLGGGFPVGALAGPRDLMHQLAPLGPVYQAGTLSANPLAMRAGLATLRLLEDGSAFRRLEALGARLERGVHAAGRHLQRAGSIFWMPGGARSSEPVRSPAQVDASLTADFPALFHRLLDAGLYLPPSPHEVGFLSLAHDETHLDHLIQSTL